MAGEKLALKQSRRSYKEELPAAQLTTVKRQLAQHLRALPIARAPETTRRAWDYGSDRSALAPLEEAYATLIEDAEDFDSSALINRAAFRSGTFDHAGSIEDYDAAIAMDPTNDLYLARGSAQFMLGEYEAALEDYRLAEDSQPDGSTYSTQIELLGLMGRGEEARALAEEYAAFADAPHEADEILGIALGWAGSPEEGIELLHSTLASRPGDGGLLNAVCWESGKWDLVNEEILETCVGAVEKFDFSPAALDSRALAQYRLGNYEAALIDADAALGEYRQMPDTRFLKGLILIAMGDRKAGQASIAEAKVMKPSVERQYAVWGLTP
jgi:tetratricopeptide (TPR) repeat protein